jgi:hypothetical protein
MADREQDMADWTPPAEGDLVRTAGHPGPPEVPAGLYIVTRHAGSGYLVGLPVSGGLEVMLAPGSIAATWKPTAKREGF